MTTKSFNAKKVLMSTVAAVVFSFVFTTNANAGTPVNAPEDSQENEEQKMPEINGDEGIVSYILNTILGVRV